MPVSGIAAHEATKRCDARLHLQPPRVAPWRRPMQRASLFLRGIAMKEIALTQGQVALVDDADYALVSVHSWCAWKPHKIYYAVSEINGRFTLMHRLILGLTDPKIIVDHKDGDGLHNYRDNIHICDHSFNRYQSLKDYPASSKFKGVSWDKEKEKWTAYFYENHRMKRIGRFEDEITAARARDKKVIKILGLEKALIGNVLNIRED